MVGQVDAPASVIPAAWPVEARALAATSAPAHQEAEMLATAESMRLYSGFALQACVFADPRHSKELHAKLTLEGIP